jgi:hypothetical protein
MEGEDGMKEDEEIKKKKMACTCTVTMMTVAPSPSVAASSFFLLDFVSSGSLLGGLGSLGALGGLDGLIPPSDEEVRFDMMVWWRK